MKYLSSFVTMLFCSITLNSQTVNVWQNPCNSAVIPEQNMLINVDIDSLDLDSCITKIFYSTDGQESWFESEMTLLTELNYTATFEDTILLPDSGRVFYGLKTIYPTYIDTIFDTLFYTMSAKNIDDIFPPTDNFLTELCEEKIGDAYQATGKPYLDLTEIRISFSDNKFYCLLDNNDNQWPFYEPPSWLPPWYVYGFGFYNPESTDSVGYTMVYADISTMNVTPGLYKVNTDSTFSRIGDIDYQIQDEKLYMACNIEDLTSDPNFGPWPNECGGLICGAGTLTINAYPFITLNDRSHPCIFYPTIFQQDIGVNELPQLSGLTFQTVSDTIVFNITYSDSNNNLPVVRKFIIENKTEFNFTSSDHYYQDGSEFNVRVPIQEVENSSVYAEFSDGADTVQSNVITFVGIDENTAELIGIQLSNYPNPFSTCTTISFFATDLHRFTRIDIYNIKGQLVRILSPMTNDQCPMTITWDGKDEKGKQMPNGIYFYRLSIKNSPIKKMLLLR
ncbi:MAG: FlgD immunoglobulin-like domain containing protein [Candidatus Cloacimonadota bacterium]|nr:FlgD immunoglobulin-like domain containing protein [Candidatus Cloacimonadota bacterium]